MNNTTQDASQNHYLRVFSIEVAQRIGLNQAIILFQLHYWLQNDKAGYWQEDGRKWVYNGYKEWQLQFPWLEVGAVGRYFRELESNGLIISSNFNNNAHDRRKWYTLDYESIRLVTGWNPLNFEIYQDCTLENPPLENALCAGDTINRNKDYPKNNPATNSTAAAEYIFPVKNQEQKYSIKENPEKNEIPSTIQAPEPATYPVQEQFFGQLLDNDKENNLSDTTEHKVENTEPAPNPEANEIVAILREAKLYNPQLRKLALQFSYEYVQATIKLCQERQRNNSKPVKNREGLFTEALKNNWASENDLSSTSGIPGCFVAWYEKACKAGIIFEPCPIKHLPLDRYREPMVRIALDASEYHIPFDTLPWKQAMEQYPLPEGYDPEIRKLIQESIGDSE